MPVLALQGFPKGETESPEWWLKSGRQDKVLGLYLLFSTFHFGVCVFRKQKTSGCAVRDRFCFTGHGAIAPL